jgi:hypothetical protein
MGSNSFCDSIIQLDLDITTIDVSLTVSNGTISASQQQNASYTWYNCQTNSIVSSGQNQFTPSTTENYSVTISANGCSESSNCVFVLPVSIEDVVSQKQPWLFPNPVESTCTVMEIGNISVYSIIGEQLFQLSLTTTPYELNLSNLASGNYIVQLQNQQGIYRMSVIKE